MFHHNGIFSDYYRNGIIPLKYKVGDIVSLSVEIFDGRKRLLGSRVAKEGAIVEEKLFPIVAIDETQKTYKIIIDDDMLGWVISGFHINYQDVPKVFLGKRFYDIVESYIGEKDKI